MAKKSKSVVPVVPQSIAYSYVRVSTPAQLKEATLNRQRNEAMASYCREKTLRLVTEFDGRSFTDAMSAFDGSHIDRGNLGKFIRQVKAGTIPKGTRLILEGLDRLDRREVNFALQTFLEIINAGIIVVTILDDRPMEFDVSEGRELTLNLMYAIIELGRSSSESKWKQKRSRDNWRQDREKMAPDWPMTSQGPAWLKPIMKIIPGRKSKEPKIVGWIPITERVKIVVEIFRLAERHGASKIATLLNEKARTDKAYKPWGQPQRRLAGRNLELVKQANPYHAWRASYIYKILTDVAVIGLYQQKEIVTVEVNGEKIKQRRDIGKPKPRFPEIINPKVFERIGRKIRKRATARGFRGKGFANIFMGMQIRCGKCQSKMHLKTYKDKRYFRCYQSINGGGCDAAGWRHDLLEDAVLAHIEEFVQKLRANRLSEADDDVEHDINEHEKKLEGLREQMVDVQLRRQLGPEANASKETALRRLERDMDKLKSKGQSLYAKRDAHSAHKGAIDSSADFASIVRAHKKLREDKDPEAYDTRAKLNDIISELVEEIILGHISDLDKPKPLLPAPKDNERDLIVLAPNIKPAKKPKGLIVAVGIAKHAPVKKAASGYAVVRFRGGGTDIIWPSVDPVADMEKQPILSMILVYDDGRIEYDP